MNPSTRASAGQDTVASLQARLARSEREAAARQHQLEAYASDLREVFKQERTRAQELRRSYKATVLALANALEARDAYTGRHAQLRSDPLTADATIIMLTGMSDQPAQDSAVGAGADLFLTKPFSPLRLLRLVDELGHGAR